MLKSFFKLKQSMLTAITRNIISSVFLKFCCCAGFPLISICNLYYFFLILGIDLSIVWLTSKKSNHPFKLLAVEIKNWIMIQSNTISCSQLSLTPVYEDSIIHRRRRKWWRRRKRGIKSDCQIIVIVCLSLHLLLSRVLISCVIAITALWHTNERSNTVIEDGLTAKWLKRNMILG